MMELKAVIIIYHHLEQETIAIWSDNLHFLYDEYKRQG